MHISASIDNLQPKEHAFVASVISIFCDPKHAHLRHELITGRAALRFDHRTPEREIQLPQLVNVTPQRL